jgi:YfiH family protein
VFAFTDTRGPVEVAFTDRHGGVSGGPYASLNLTANGEHVDTVEENLAIVAHAVARGGEPASREALLELPPGLPLPRVALMRQVHGADVAVVGPDGHAEPPEADALVTEQEGVLLVVRVADCVPLVLADTRRRVVGAVHAGRPGLVAGVVPAALRAMRDLGAERIVAWKGPHVCGSCYEVPAEMREEVAAVVPEAWSETSWGTPAVDVGAGVLAQLRAAGVAEVVDASRCTLEDEDLYSYRRQGSESGRMAGLVWVRP